MGVIRIIQSNTRGYRQSLLLSLFRRFRLRLPIPSIYNVWHVIHQPENPWGSLLIVPSITSSNHTRYLLMERKGSVVDKVIKTTKLPIPDLYLIIRNQKQTS